MNDKRVEILHIFTPALAQFLFRVGLGIHHEDEKAVRNIPTRLTPQLRAVNTIHGFSEGFRFLGFWGDNRRERLWERQLWCDAIVDTCPSEGDGRRTNLFTATRWVCSPETEAERVV
jgi:hypothetical protein